MKISPLDIKKQVFTKRFKGYSPEEVHSYLEMIADELEEAFKANLQFEEKLSSLKEKLSSYTRIEDILQDTLLTTQKSAEETKSAAERKATAIIDEARVEADRLLADARKTLLDIQREIADLRHQRDAFIIGFKSMLDTQQSLLEIIEKKGESRDELASVKMKSDLSDDELEKITDNFEKELQAKNSSDHGNNSHTITEEET